MKLLLSLRAASQPVLLASNSCNLWLNIYDAQSVFLCALKRDMRTQWQLPQNTSETIKTYVLFVKTWNPQLIIKMNTNSTAMAFDLKDKKSKIQNDWSTTKTKSHFPNCKFSDSASWFVTSPPPKKKLGNRRELRHVFVQMLVDRSTWSFVSKDWLGSLGRTQ